LKFTEKGGDIKEEITASIGELLKVLVVGDIVLLKIQTEVNQLQMNTEEDETS